MSQVREKEIKQNKVKMYKDDWNQNQSINKRINTQATGENVKITTTTP